MRTLALTVCLSICAAPALAAGDAEAGKKVFRKCAGCHQIGDGAVNRTGPVLTGVIGRPAGSVDGFKYSASMRAAGAAGHVWDEASIFTYIENPTAYLRTLLDDPKARAKMTFRLKKPKDRENVIAYLATFSVAAADPASVCVTNGAEATHFFAVEASSSERETAMLEPGATLCLPSEGRGVVSVFDTGEELEGCSRLVASGETERLIRYADFDRCAWGSNSD